MMVKRTRPTKEIKLENWISEAKPVKKSVKKEIIIENWLPKAAPKSRKKEIRLENWLPEANKPAPSAGTPAGTSAAPTTMPPVPPKFRGAAKKNGPSKNAMNPGNPETPKPTFNPSSVVLSKSLRMVEQVLDNMTLKHGTSVLLAGDPGVGKTTFIKKFSKLVGMPVITIEAPHITEEHLINIPFIIFNPVIDTTKQGTMVVDMNKFEISLSKSNLATQLQNLKAVDNATYAKMIQGFDRNLTELYHELGGSDTAMPKEIQQARSQYRGILFLDEYFRQTSANVRNILRGILNGRIGNDRIPAGIYVVYASNLSDTGGLEDLPLNTDFKKLEFGQPDKNEWFHYMVSKFEKDQHVKLKKEVIDAFYAGLKDTHLSFNDLESEIRTSPRRWEQLLLYINESVPVESHQEANELLSNVQANFKNQDKISTLYKLVRGIVTQLIEETSGIDAGSVSELPASEWRKTLEHQIKIKAKLGDHRSYIPVVQGLPGIGKSAQAEQLAYDLNMRLIPIDASTLSTDDINGIPLPNKQEGELGVKFSPPALYQRIIKDIHEADADFYASATPERAAAYKKQPFKYLIFFDEINRVSTINVFNALRRVILEKSFSDELKLPKDSIIIAAMNPTDKGTIDLTGHLKDVVDLIDTAPSWKKLEDHIKDKIDNKLQAYSTTAKNAAKAVLQQFVDTFTIKRFGAGVDQDSAKFYIAMKDAGTVYISPREYTTLYQDLVAGIERGLKKPAEDQEIMVENVKQQMEDKIHATLGFILDKHGINSPQFLAQVKQWIASSEVIKKALTKVRTVASLSEILSDIMKNPHKHLKDDIDFNSYLQSFELNKFSEDLHNYFHELLKDKSDKLESIEKKTHNKKIIKGQVIEILEEMISEVAFVSREILNAVKIHDLSGDVYDQVKDVMDDLLKDLLHDPDIVPQDKFEYMLNVGTDKLIKDAGLEKPEKTEKTEK
jgi:MoxR-like ATPase